MLPKYRKRAVSTVISTVLMTTLTLTLGVMTFFWGAQIFGVQMGNAGIYFQNKSSSMLENAIIEDVWFIQPKNVSVTVRNAGSIDIRIVAIYINSTAQSTISPQIPSSGYQLTVGNSVTFTITYNKSGFTQWTANQFAYISFATARGLVIRGYWSTTN